MHLVVAHDDTTRDVVVAVDDPAATVADLQSALGLPATPGVDIDDRFVPADLRLSEAGLVDGAVVTPAQRHGPAWQDATPIAWLTVVAGPGTGDRIALRHNMVVVVGRQSDCDLVLASASVSARHAMVTMDGHGEVVVEDADSRNGTWVDGRSIHASTPLSIGAVFRCGGVVLSLDGPDPDDAPQDVSTDGLTGTTPFNRKPRATPPAAPRPLQAPAKPGLSTQSRGFRAAALISPILMGGFMVLRSGDIRYAGFMVISPIAMLAMWLSDKRRASKEGKANTATFKANLATFGEDLASRWQDTRRRAERAAPDMSEVLRRSRAPSTHLWERRLSHPDALLVRVGSADQPWRAPVEGAAGQDHQAEPQVVDLLEAHATMPNAPVTVRLSPMKASRGMGQVAPPGLGAASSADGPGGGSGPGPGGGSGPGPGNGPGIGPGAIGPDGRADANLPGGVVGIVGDGDAPRALARALVVQAATFHGPADLRMGILTDEQHRDAWRWAKWLPHTRSADGRVRMVGDRRRVSTQLADGLLDALLDESDRPGLGTHDHVVSTVPLLVVDDVALLRGRDAAARRLLAGDGGPATGIVIAATVDQLPASCRTVVTCAPDGHTVTVQWPGVGSRLPEVIPAGASVDQALQAARAMARWDDPDLSAAGGSVPDLVRLLPLLELDDPTPDQLQAQWRSAGTDPGAPATLGMTADGPFTLDLPTDGPHGLVGGTTGSGKSELLRSMVASMAARVDPDHLVFVLVDYKGGSAFDLCAHLPHTVGMVTDLDPHLGTRALTSLEAEVHHREVVLRDAGAQDLPAYLDLGSPAGPMPRLVVVVDEFATMATDLPDFLGALVSVAQRGRSLGIHLVLATQRPRGAVNADVRANTNLRIALRVQDPGDSTDIIDVPDAAELPRDKPGRAWVRRGHGDLVLVQSALSTAGAPAGQRPIRVVPFRFTPTSPLPTLDLQGPSDLQRLVETCQQAFAASGRPAPRKPWLPMPPAEIPLQDLLDMPDQPDGVVFGLEDVPEEQAQRPFAWRPEDGHLGMFGMVGSGTTTALLAVAASAATTASPDKIHIQAIDFGGGGLRRIRGLPHVGAVVDGADSARQARLVSRLLEEVTRRRQLEPDERAELPLVIVLIDKVGGFFAEHDSIESRSIIEQFQRVFKEGPAVRIVAAVTSEATRDLPSRLRGQVTTTLTFRVADTPGLVSDMPDLSPGQAWHELAEHVVQIGLPGDVEALVEGLPAPTVHPPDPIATLPDELPASRVPVRPTGDTTPLRIPIGLAAATMEPAALELHPGDHVAVVGPPRSGKSSLLQLLSSQLRTLVPDAIQLALCDALRSPLADWPSLDGSGPVEDLHPHLEAAVTDSRPWFVMVDGAGSIDDDPVMKQVVSARPDLCVVAAGRPSDMRGGYGGWLRTLRASRTGVLLQPDLPGDGDMLSTKLPRRTTTPLVVGRGFVVNAGTHSLAQIALPPAEPPAGSINAGQPSP